MNRGLDSYKLKLIALLFMLIDHVHTYLTYREWPQWISLTTRFVSPLFLYLMIYGFYYTRSRKQYLIRLTVAGVIMMAGNIVINYFTHNVDYRTGEISFRSLRQGHDIFLTLAVMFAIVWCLENIKQKNKVVLNVFMVIILAFLSLFCEGGLELLPMTLIIWFFRGKKSMQCAGIGVYCLAWLAKSLFSYFTATIGSTSFYSHICFDHNWAMFLVIPFILLYNGERGRNTTFSKYMFYIIYPAHLWILMILRYVIIGN